MQYALLTAAGLLAGLMGGMLGVGGSVIMIPAMVWIFGARVGGVEQIHQYQAAAMIMNFLLILPSVAAHWRRKAIWLGVWKYLTAAALVGVVAGVQVSWLFRGPAGRYLRWFLGGFFGYVAIYNLWQMLDGRRTEGLQRQQVEAGPRWHKLAAGLPVGFLAGLSGIGGGSLAVPIQQIALRMPLRNAIATSAATIASISWLGAILKNAQLGQQGSVGRSLLLAACLAPTAMAGSYAGGHLTHLLPLRFVRGAFVALMAASAWKMFAG